jgi:uncharacterized protein YodC (DUF2158 family)
MMATKFKVGDSVKLNKTVPSGPVQEYRMLADGTVQCLIQWENEAGETHQRWFNEDDLIGA